MPFFEIIIKSLRNIISEFLYKTFIDGQIYTQQRTLILDNIWNHILSHSILQQANSDNFSDSKTEFSKLGIGYALCHPGDENDSMADMNYEDTGGKC